MDEHMSRTVCQLIAGIIVADDDLDPAEDAFVERMLASFELAPEARKSMFPIVDRQEAAAAMRALPPEVQVYTLAVLVQAAAVDGRVVPREREFLYAVASAMGVDKTELDDRIRRQLASLC